MADLLGIVSRNTMTKPLFIKTAECLDDYF